MPALPRADPRREHGRARSLGFFFHFFSAFHALPLPPMPFSRPFFGRFCMQADPRPPPPSLFCLFCPALLGRRDKA